MASPFDQFDSQFAAMDRQMADLTRQMDRDMDNAFREMDRCAAGSAAASAGHHSNEGKPLGGYRDPCG
jgi:hypothetical protein